MIPTADNAAPKPARKRPPRKATAPKAPAPAGGSDAEGTATGGDIVAPAASSSSSRGAKVGDVVQYTYFDHYAGAGGEDITVPALVVGLGEDGATVIPLGGPHPTVPLDALSAG